MRLGRAWLFVLVLLSLLTGCSLFSSSKPTRFTEYTVKSGDTISALSQRYNVQMADIIEANRIDDPRKLSVGQVLRIPLRKGTSITSTSNEKENSVAKMTVDPNSMKTIKFSSARRYVGKMLWPVRGAVLASRFGRRWLSFHEGLDLAAPEGTLIRAAHDGVIVYSDDGLRGYGNLIVLKGEGLLTVYGHNRVNRARRGDHVDRGDVIAEVGQSGKAQGPHVHFETRIKDSSGTYTAIDPLVFYR